MARIENHKYTIESAFRECFYVVPSYQREYVWKDKQVVQLLEDISEQSASEQSEYFIGMILVSPKRNNKNHFDIIDGQQRLTTLFLLLCSLRSRFKDFNQPLYELLSPLIESRYTESDGNPVSSFKLETNYVNARGVLQEIAEFNKSPQEVGAFIKGSSFSKSGSVKNILTAYATINSFLQSNYTNDGLVRFWGRLANDIVFIQIAADTSSALKIFETINERGVGLNSMDLLKNLLFAKVKDDSFGKLKDEWMKVTAPLESNKEKPLRFLRYFVMANYTIKNHAKGAVVTEDQIYNWFSKKENRDLVGYQEDPFKFVEQLVQNVSHYINFNKGLGNDGEPSQAMSSLKELTRNSFKLHYILFLSAASLPKPLFDQFIPQVESLLFYYIFTKSPTRDLERLFSLWADEIRDIVQIKDREQQRQKLNAFVEERFAADMLKKKPDLDDALSRLASETMQKYRTKYLLARLSQHVDMEFLGSTDERGLDYYFKLEIEHILPTNPEDDSLKQWQEANSDADYCEASRRLGNLTLLEKPLNRSIGNNTYAEKCVVYADSTVYLTSSLVKLKSIGDNTSVTRINKKLCAFDKWNAEDIENRQKMLINLVHEIWRTKEIV